MRLFLHINIEIPTVVGIFTFMSMKKNAFSAGLSMDSGHAFHNQNVLERQPKMVLKRISAF